MAVTFVVEDGTGLSTATSYLSIADFKQYWEDRGVDYSALTDATIQPLLNRATQVIDQRYTFYGKVKSSTQALQFPRTDIYDKNDVKISSSIVPVPVENATAEIAKALYVADQAEGSITDPNAAPSGIRSKSLGPMSVEYAPGASGVNSAIKYTNADLYLRPLIQRALRV